MKRRSFLYLWCMASFGNRLLAMDYRKYYPQAWSASSLNDAAIALYGRNKFLSLKKSDKVRLTVPSGIVKDRKNIVISITSSLPAKTLSIFQDVNQQSLVSVFQLNENSVLSYEISLRMESKGTVFAVIESLDGKLYYAREHVEILTLSCMAS